MTTKRKQKKKKKYGWREDPKENNPNKASFLQPRPRNRTQARKDKGMAESRDNIQIRANDDDGEIMINMRGWARLLLLLLCESPLGFPPPFPSLPLFTDSLLLHPSLCLSVYHTKIALT